jgi:uncharacterized protein YjbI with pentapeptide repeats
MTPADDGPTPGADAPLEGLERVLAEHARWVETGGESGRQAQLAQSRLARLDLSGRLLRGADLAGADLRETRLCGADLADANLEEADLRGADLGDAVLTGAVLEGADVSGAVLVRADLAGARLQGIRGLALAELRDAGLEGARGLTAGDLAGADLTGVRLPTTLAGLDRMEHLAAAIGIARPLYLFVLVVTAFILLTVFSTPDVSLFTNARSAVMPNLPTAIPAASLFWIAPLILVFLYAYQHFYIARVWDGIAGLPDVLPDGSSIARSAHPWLVLELVRLRRGREAVGFREVVVIFLIWGAVPATLAAIWWRYLPLRDWPVTLVHIVVVLLAVWGGMRLFGNAVSRLLRRSWRVPHQRATLTLLAAGMLLVSVFFHALPWILDRLADEPPGDGLSAWPEAPGIKPKNVRWLIADLEDGDLESAVMERADLRYAYGHRARLQRVNLKDARLAGSDFQRADFSLGLLDDADLSDANLDSVRFRNACLRRALLRRSDLEDTDLTGAYLGAADLTLAYLGRARLSYANFQGARLTGTDFTDANLRGAVFNCFASHQHDPERDVEVRCPDFRGTNFAGADLTGAQFLGADLTGAKNLVPAQLQSACGVDVALVPNLSKYLPDCGVAANRGISPAALDDGSPIDPEENPCWHEMLSDYDPGPPTHR